MNSAEYNTPELQDPNISSMSEIGPGTENHFESRDQMQIVIVGHVDHGKSTVIGRLLADTDSLPHGKIDSIRELCERNSKPFEYAFLLDALKDEQSQGITIDTARIFFKSEQRDYIILDAPGHIEFLKNMVTGAARAECALLVIDANEGIRVNSRRHGYLLSMLGIKQVAVLVNKMDLVRYSKSTFDDIRKEFTAFLARVDTVPLGFIPIAAREGENIVEASDKMPWYDGPSVLQMVDLFQKESKKTLQNFRMPVQDVYKFTAMGDDRRVVAGRIETGSIAVGDEVLFLPSNKRATIASIEGFNIAPSSSISAGYSAGFTLTEQIYIQRGELMTKTSEIAAKVSSRLRVNIFWMGRKPMTRAGNYFLKIGTSKTPVKLDKINYLIDASDTLDQQEKSQIDRHDVADCILELNRAIAFDPISIMEATGRFVIVDQYEIAGGGIIRESLQDAQVPMREEIAQREIKFERSFISPRLRQERMSQKPTLVLITGQESTDRKGVAKALEEELFNRGRYVYYIGMANLVYSLDADIGISEAMPAEEVRPEHMRRLGELAYLMLEAGLILIVSARDLEPTELKGLETMIAPYPMLTVCLGGCRLGFDGEMLYPDESNKTAVTQVIDWLQTRKSILSF